MSEGSTKLSCYRLRLGTLAVLMVIAAAIVLANSASEPVTIEYVNEAVFSGKPAERVYGWPLHWYSRMRKQDPGSQWPMTSHWPVSRYSASDLLANAVLWGVLLVAAAVSFELVLRKHQPRFHWRPRVTTIVPAVLLSVCTVLANLSFERAGPSRLQEYSNYGWPLVWYRRVDIFIPFGVGAHIQEWDYRAAGLAGNLVLWLLMLAASALAWGWLMRHYRPRLRWSMRAMLVGVAIIAALCTRFVVARDRANKQDAFIESAHIYEDETPVDWSGIEEDQIYVERRSPKWLSVVGADRFCRHIVGLRFATLYNNNDAEHNLELFKQLAHLPSLRFLEIEPDARPYQPREFAPNMAAILSEMRQLRMLDLDCRGDYFSRHRDDYQQSTLNCAHAYLEAVGKLTGLKRLRLRLWASCASDLARLSELKNLKMLVLDITPIDEQINSGANISDRNVATHMLANFPVLPKLEQLDLNNSSVGDEDVGRLSGFKRLKSLNLSMTLVTDAGLARLAPLTSLEELAIDQRMVTSKGFEALARLDRLRAVHIDEYSDFDGTGSTAWLPLDNGGQLAVPHSEVESQLRALEMLRQTHPGIVIDADYDGFESRGDLEIPWDGDVRAFVRRWLYER